MQAPMHFAQNWLSSYVRSVSPFLLEAKCFMSSTCIFLYQLCFLGEEFVRSIESSYNYVQYLIQKCSW